MYELLFDSTLSMKSFCFNEDPLAWFQSHKLSLKGIFYLLTNYLYEFYL